MNYIKILIWYLAGSSGGSSEKSILSSIADFLRTSGLAEGDSEASAAPPASEPSPTSLSEFLERTEAELLSWDQEDRESLAYQLMNSLRRSHSDSYTSGRRFDKNLRLQVSLT